MNNSDFLSDAVALDLGKSGVKVAETLEIEVGNEWWRLINAADVTGARMYQGRQLPDPIVVGGKILLGDLASRRGIALPPANTAATPWKYQLPGVTGFLTNGTMFYAILAQYAAWGGIGSPIVPRLRVYAEDGTVIGTSAASAYDSSLVPNVLLWDAVNKTLIGVVTNAGNSQSRFYAGAIDGATFVLSGAYLNQNVAEFRDARTFLEAPSAIYSVFLSSGGTVRVKKTEPVVGDTAYTVGSTVILPGGTTVPAVTQATGAWLFYSRWYESPAVLWQENATKICYYAVESEGWATAHPLPDITSGAEWTVRTRGVGNLAITDNGDFIIAGLEKMPAGNLTRPVGWSYPANLTILGTAGIAKDKGVILAIVGNTLWRLEVDLTTYAISRVASVDAGRSLSGWLPELVYKGGTKEIWIFREMVASNVMNRTNLMLCYDTSNDTLPWVWTASEFADAVLFPQTTLSSTDSDPTHIITRAGNNAIIWRFRYYGSSPVGKRSETYMVPLATLAACGDITAVKAAVGASGRQYTLLTHALANNGPGNSSGPSHVIEDDAYYYIFSQYETKLKRSYFAKDTGKLVNVTESAGSGTSLGPPLLFFAPQRFVDYGYFQSVISTEEAWQDDFAAYLVRAYDTTYTTYLGVGKVIPSTNIFTKVAPGYYGLDTNIAVGIPLASRNSRLWAYGAGTKFTLLGVTFDGGQDVGMDRQDFTLAHTHHRVLYEPVGGKILPPLSAVTGGEIKYAAFCDKGPLQKNRGDRQHRIGLRG